ncbi:hypothetical protein HWV62_5039 [Athelia sp. TMB]|nr:hypothetical protein HWV62_23553 [Athelia sp. TMB]KAF7976968.1 hypothetical protein HWV62_5039 [Athelia sp. TMB]
MARRTKFDRSRMCVKCKASAGNIVIRHAVYCKECFAPLQITKLKRALEPTVNSAKGKGSRNKLKAGGNLAIGFSGGLGSTVLLDMIARCYYSAPAGGVRGGTQHPRNNETVWAEARVFYVEMCAAYPESAARDRTEEMREVVGRYPAFAFCSLRIEDAFDPAWWARVGGRSPTAERAIGVIVSDALSLAPAPASTPAAALTAYLSSLPTPTAAATALATLTRLVLLYAAASARSSHLILGTTLTSLSVGLIAGVATGAGFVVREEAGETWGESEGEGVRVVKPLRDMGTKECAAWAWWHDLAVPGNPKYTNPGAKQGIGGLTKDFIVGLERDYPSTVSTIARTCAKLAPKAAANERCVLCERPAQKGVQEWKARIAIRSFADSPKSSQIETPLSSASSGPHANSDASHDRPPPTLTPHLCYACHTAFTSRSSRSTAHAVAQDGPVPLPAWAAAGIGARGDGAGGEVWEGKHMGVGEMRSAIVDFLLED